MIPLVFATALAVAVIAVIELRSPAPAPAPTQAPGLDFSRPPAADPVPWDAVAWKEVEATGFELPAGAHVDGLTAWSSGLIAYGSGPAPAGVPGLGAIAVTGTLWLSGDAITWHAIPMLAGVPPGSASELHAVAAGPRGIVAIGTVCCADQQRSAWWSRDGRAWLRVSFPRQFDGGVAAAAAGAAGFVAVGQSGNDAAIWSSEDGLEWRSVLPEGRALGRGQMARVVATQNGFVAVGTVDVRPSDSDGVVWVSDGLAHWERLAGADPALTGEDEVSLSHVVGFAGGWFTSGGIGAKADRVSCEQLLSGAASAGASVALSCGWLREMNWRSGGLDAWERVDPWGADGAFPPDFVPPGRAPANWERVVAGGPGLVSIPYELEENDPNGGGDELGVWTSANAGDWRRVGHGPALAGESMAGFVVVGRGILVVSEKGGVAVGDVLP